MGWIGERLFTLAAFNDLLNGGSRPLSIVQPDICHAGGISGLKKIAAIAEANYCQVAPHNPNGAVHTLLLPLAYPSPATCNACFCAFHYAFGLQVSTAASFALGACIPNLLVQEFTTLGEDYLRDPFRMGNDGYVDVPLCMCALHLSLFGVINFYDQSARHV